jgi:hypothetical protein
MEESMNHNTKSYNEREEMVKRAGVKETERMQISWKPYYSAPQRYIRRQDVTTTT